MEFKKFESIERFNSNITITEKVHGTNAQIIIDDAGNIQAASRTRLIYPGNDNFAFALFVEQNKVELIEALGPGRHFGEWYGSGINSGYGMKNGERKLALFYQYPKEKPLPPQVTMVPILYEGPFIEGIVEQTMNKLKTEGSAIQPGFMRPEGVVIRFGRNGAMFKKVFEAEETAWKSSDKPKPPVNGVDPEKVNALLQPIRLEKLLSTDERYTKDFPESLPSIVKEYVADMEKEDQLKDVDPFVVKAFKGELFKWVKIVLKEKGYTA